jgi:hypothetical protein
MILGTVELHEEPYATTLKLQRFKADQYRLSRLDLWIQDEIYRLHVQGFAQDNPRHAPLLLSMTNPEDIRALAALLIEGAQELERLMPPSYWQPTPQRSL